MLKPALTHTDVIGYKVVCDVKNNKKNNKKKTPAISNSVFKTFSTAFLRRKYSAIVLTYEFAHFHHSFHHRRSLIYFKMYCNLFLCCFCNSL